MKIKCVDNRKFVIKEADVQAIQDNNVASVIINGNEYYLAQIERTCNNWFEATYMSKNQIEIELEVING